MTLHKPRNAVKICMAAELLQETEEVEGEAPCWLLRGSLSRQAPGAPGAYTKVWQTGRAGMGGPAGQGHSANSSALKFPAGKSVSSITDIEAELLVEGRLRLRLEVSACGTP